MGNEGKINWSVGRIKECSAREARGLPEPERTEISEEGTGDRTIVIQQTAAWV